MSTAWLKALVVDWAILIFGISLSYVSLWFLPLSILIVGNRQQAIGILGHEGAHQLIIPRHRFWNDLVANIGCWWWLGINLHRYRLFHWEHHHYVNTPRDPELPLKEVRPSAITMPYTQAKVWRQAGLDLVGFGVPQLIAFMWHVRPRDPIEMCSIVFSLVVHSVFIWTGFGLVTVIWYTALATSFWACFRLRIYTEHIGVPYVQIWQPTWWQKALFCPHNIWCHYEHHEHPGIPFNFLTTQRILVISYIYLENLQIYC